MFINISWLLSRNLLQEVRRYLTDFRYCMNCMKFFDNTEHKHCIEGIWVKNFYWTREGVCGKFQEIICSSRTICWKIALSVLKCFSMIIYTYFIYDIYDKLILANSDPYMNRWTFCHMTTFEIEEKKLWCFDMLLRNNSKVLHYKYW